MALEINWKTPDYDPIWKERIDRLGRLRADPSLIGPLKAYYKNRPVSFINDWGVTVDPRNAELGRSTVMPFILWPRQAEFVMWLYELWQDRKDGLCEKTRDAGASWLCIGFAVWMWSFHAGSVVGFGSRKEEYVDNSKDQKSLFWKARKFVELLPQEFKPAGYDPKKHATHMLLSNPENEALIAGEAGDNIGRGARTSIYFKDESAHYEHQELIDAALSETSNCKIDISSVNGNGNLFYRKRHSGKIDVFVFDWRDDPRKSQEWYDAKKAATTDVKMLAQELDRDYNASSTDNYIDGELITASQNTPRASIEAVGQWILGVDAAHMGDDKSVITPRRGRIALDQIERRKMDGTQLAWLVEQTCQELEPIAPIFAIVIELDGPGVSAYDQMKLGRYAKHVIGLHTGQMLKDDRNWNLRAKMWRAALDWLKATPNSMPKSEELKTQLASLKASYKDGLLLMQSKKQYKAQYGKSPDNADSFILTFGAEEGPRASSRSNTTNAADAWRL